MNHKSRQCTALCKQVRRFGPCARTVGGREIKIWWRRWGVGGGGIQSYKLRRDAFKEHTDGIVQSEVFGACENKEEEKKKQER